MQQTYSVASLLDFNFMLLNKLAILSLTMLFFCMVLVRRRARGVVTGDAAVPIQLALLGYALLYAETQLTGAERFREVVSSLQMVVVLLCMARLAIHLVVEVYLPFRTKREPPGFLRDTIRLVVYLLAGVASLRLVFDVNLSAVVTTTTVLTAMVAFALQNSLTNALSGFAIQGERLLARRNWIAIREKNIFGEIVNVGFRFTTLRNPDNNLILVPNSTIIHNIVTIHGTDNSDERPAVLLDVALEYSLPPETARELLLTVLRDEPTVLSSPEPAVRLYSLSDSSVVYQLKFWIDNPGQKVPTADRIYTQVWYAVTRAGHSFPFPQRHLITGVHRQPFSFSRELVLRQLRQADLFQGLLAEQLERLAENVPVRVYGPNEVVVRQGDGGSSLFIVLKGTLDVFVDDMRVGGLEEGACFGEMSLLTGAPRAATVRALCEVWLTEVTKELMEPLLRENPSVMEMLSTLLAEREQRNLTAAQPGELLSAPPGRSEYLKRLKSFFRL